MTRLFLLMFSACPGLLLAVDSAIGPFSVQITRSNAEVELGAPLVITVAVQVADPSADWQISGSALCQVENFIRVRPATSRASTAGQPAALVPAGHAEVHDVPEWIQAAAVMPRIEVDLQVLFVDWLMAREDFSPVLMPGDYDVTYEATAVIRRSPTPAEPTPTGQKVVLTSNMFTITILPPTAANLAWCLTTVNGPGAKPEDLQRAMMIARAAPVAHRRAVLESGFSDTWYRTMALLRLAADRPDPSLANAVVPWVESDHDQIAASALAALAECDPVQALVAARQLGPLMSPGNFRIVTEIFHHHGLAEDVSVLEAMLKRVPEPTDEEKEFAGFDVQQADRDMITAAIAAIRARQAQK